MQKSSKYLLIDRGGVLEGIPKANAKKIEENDIVFLYGDSKTEYVLKNGLLIAQNLNTLIKTFGYEIIVYAKSQVDNMLGLLRSLKQACEQRGTPWPRVYAAAVRDDKKFGGVTPENPVVNKNSEHDILIIGYSTERPGKSCVRAAISQSLGISKEHRKDNFVLDDGPSIIKAAAQEGWTAYEINDMHAKSTLHGVIDEILRAVAASQKKGPNFDKFLTDIVKSADLFKPTDKPRSETQDTESFSAGIFINTKTQTEWIGTCSVFDDLEHSDAEACKQRIAADIYRCYGVTVPQVEMSLQKMINTGVPDEEKEPYYHVMCEIIPQVVSYNKGCGSKLNIQCPNKGGELILEDGKSVKERELGKILAVALFINDVNVIGIDGNNIGFRIEEAKDGTKYANTVKLGPFELLDESYEEMKEQRIQVAKVFDYEKYLEYAHLPRHTQEEFLQTLITIKETPEAVIQKFFDREGTEIYTSFVDIPDLASALIKRRAMIMKLFEKEINGMLNKGK